MRRIETIAELEALYDAAVPASLFKVADHLTPSYRRWVKAARFCVISTAGSRGTHGTPRGDIAAKGKGSIPMFWVEPSAER